MARKEDSDPDPPLTVEEAKQMACAVAEAYGVFECDQCAMAIAKRLGKGCGATFERLRTSDHSDVIGLVYEGIQISRNRAHVGVRIGDRIIDNLYHEGVTEGEWAGRFMSATAAPLVRQSKPVGDFFG